MCLTRHTDLAKTVTYFVVHITIGFTIAYLFTGSVAIAGGIALVEPLANGVAYFFHEKAWNRWSRAQSAPLVASSPA